MAISFTRYIDLVSGVGAQGGVTGRQFIGRLFTTNELLPPQTLIEFSSSAEVGTYFGTASAEYARAVFYFRWISKNITTPQSISFARWVDVATAPIIFGAVKTQDLAFYQATSDATFGITIDGDAQTFTVDTTTALSLTDVATLLQAQVNLAVGIMWTAAIITWESVGGFFKFIGGDAIPAIITVQEGVLGTPIAGDLGWLVGATLSNGSAVETITETLTLSWDASNNFGTLLFMPTLTLPEIEEGAIWTDDKNVRVMYTVPCTLLNFVAYRAALKNYGGVELTLSELAGEYPEQAPMMIFAATNYEAINSVQNYMFQEFDLTPSVTDDATADLMDASVINFYGETQQAGRAVDLYQRGVLQGLETSPSAMNVFADEIWFKDAIGVNVMNLLLAFAQIPANSSGCLQIVTVSTSVIQQALDNGTISAGKLLTAVQKQFITNATNDPNAWQQVQNLGYWINCVIQTFMVGIIEQKKAVITIIYSKDDVINKVDGLDILI